MKVEIVSVLELNCNWMNTGDTLIGRHKYYDDNLVERESVVRLHVHRKGQPTHSIIVKMDGFVQHLVGDAKLVSWWQGVASVGGVQ